MKILIIGGGIFGCSCASILAGNNNVIDLVESGSDIMGKASFVNHNRIHLGYHYLRSIETAEQSIEGLLSFLFNFGDSVIHQFPNYYAIAKEGSKTSPEKFIEFCDRVGIGYEEEFPDDHFISKDSIQASFRVPEPIWDYKKLKATLMKSLLKTGINIFFDTSCEGITQLTDGTFQVKFNKGTKFYDVVINATYSNINNINKMLGIAPKKLLFEDVIIPVFNYPSKPIGLTIMDGPFCSIMPLGTTENQFLLYHVKESIIESKIDIMCPEFQKDENGIKELFGLDGIYTKSAFFYPFLKYVKHININRTTRTVYENSDDARVTELYTYDSIKNYFSILSGKVTTCIQVALEIKHILQGKQKAKRVKI